VSFPRGSECEPVPGKVQTKKRRGNGKSSTRQRSAPDHSFWKLPQRFLIPLVREFTPKCGTTIHSASVQLVARDVARPKVMMTAGVRESRTPTNLLAIASQFRVRVHQGKVENPSRPFYTYDTVPVDTERSHSSALLSHALVVNYSASCGRQPNR